MLLYFICGTLGIVCIILLSYIIGLKRNMRGMRAELEFSKKEDYNRQVRISIYDKELTMLAAGVNEMLDYQKKIKHHTAETEQKMQRGASDIAHDLRTPLTVIKGNLQMLQKNGALSSQDRNYVEICLKKTDELRDMSDNFFDMVVLETAESEVEIKPVDITNLIAQFIVDCESVICEKGCEPQIHLPEKSMMICANEQMLLRMLHNLLNNTLKYAEGNFQIRIRENPDGGVCDICFGNTVKRGTEPDVERIFERTYRGGGARNGSGAGLGLYIVKLLAHKQGAEVSAGLKGQYLEIVLHYPMVML